MPMDPSQGMGGMTPQQKLAMILSGQQPTNNPYAGAGNAGSDLARAYMMRQMMPQQMTQTMQNNPATTQMMNQGMQGGGLMSRLGSLFGMGGGSGS